MKRAQADRQWSLLASAGLAAATSFGAILFVGMANGCQCATGNC